MSHGQESGELKPKLSGWSRRRTSDLPHTQDVLSPQYHPKFLSYSNNITDLIYTRDEQFIHVVNLVLLGSPPVEARGAVKQAVVPFGKNKTTTL